MSTLETIKLDIDEKAYSYAKIYASLLNDEYQRKRAYASIVALYAFLNKLEESSYNIQKAMTLFRNPILNEQYEISDIYVNNWRLDVRVVTDGNAFLAPKIHFDEDILPDYYVVIKVDKDLKNAEFIGIYDTKENKDEPYDYNYRSIPFSCLMSYGEFLNKVRTEKQESVSEEDRIFFNETYLGIMDNDLGTATKNRLVKLLFGNSELRTEFCCFTGFEMVSSNSSQYTDLFRDNMLGIVGANDVDSPKYEGKEEQIYIGDDDAKNNFAEDKQQEEEPEETVADILDELFGADEETIETDTITEKPVETIVEQTNNLVEENKLDELPDNILEDKETITAIDEDLQIISDDDAPAIVEETDDEVIEFLDDTQDNIRPMGAVDYIDDASSVPEAADDVQKVIVDYDESGEPIYSYITNVDNGEADLFSDIEAEVEEETLQPEESLIEEIHDDETEIFEDTSEIKNIDNIEEISNIEDIKEEEIINNNSSEIETIEETIEEPIKEKTEDTSGYEYFDEFEDKSDEVNEISDVEEYPDNNIEDTNADEMIDFPGTTDNEVKNDEISDSSDETEGELQAEETDVLENDEENESEDAAGDTEDVLEGETEEGGEYEDDELEMPEEQSDNGSRKKLVAGIVGGIVALGLLGGGTALYLNHSKAEKIVNAPVQENTQQDNMFDQGGDNEGFNPQEGDGQDFFGGEGEVPPEENANENQDNPDGQFAEENQNQPEENQQQDNGNMPQLTENDLLAQNNNPEGDVNKAMVNSFAQGGTSSVSLRGLNWFCATELFADNAFKNYLQNLDNILKQNLKNNLMNATENPSNNTVEAKFAVNNNGNLEKVIISNSSGSKEIDDLVLRSINETFEGEKSQILDNSALKSDRYYLKVAIKL